MADADQKVAEVVSTPEPPKPVPVPPPEAPKDVVEEKAVVTPTPPPPAPVESVEKVAEPIVPVTEKTSANRDAVLAKVESEKRLSLVKAWEDSEKAKADNKFQKKLSEIVAWENSKKAALEAELKKIEEDFDKKKAAYVEKTKNKVALIHKSAEEKRAMVEAKRGEELLIAEEKAAKYRASGLVPKKLFGCLGS